MLFESLLPFLLHADPLTPTTRMGYQVLAPKKMKDMKVISFSFQSRRNVHKSMVLVVFMLIDLKMTSKVLASCLMT